MRPPTDPLERIARAARARESAEREYRSALFAAYAANYGYPSIAAAAGITRQAARQLLERAFASDGAYCDECELWIPGDSAGLHRPSCSRFVAATS